MAKSAVLKQVCLAVVFLAAMAIPSLGQTLTTLVSFEGTNGADPRSSLIQATDGNFYGTSYSQGTSDYCNGCGTVFKVDPDGTLTTLHNFCSQPHCTDGGGPYAGLVQGTDGNFYGTTYAGGPDGDYGTVFKITPAGGFTTLHNFCRQGDCSGGANPYAGLVQATDGNFYGTTLNGGLGSHGTVFRITPSGELATLYSFCTQGNCLDGAAPYAGLVQATDGSLYGTTYYGGAKDSGTVFKITSGGTLTTLYSFCAEEKCADGANPLAGLVQASDGNFYGTTLDGGDNAQGSVFKITPNGALTTLYSFCSEANCPDGASPYAGLVQASDGNFYGTTYFGGDNAQGTVFMIAPGGALTTVYSFCSKANCTDGASSYAGLLEGSDGNFYGTTAAGGTINDRCPSGCGTVFSLSAGLSPSPLQFVPVTPCRLVDTRTQYGGGGPIQGGTFQTFDLPAIAKNNDCADLSPALVYSLNVAVVPQGPLGYLTVWPAGEHKPNVATLNSLDGRVKANAAMVQAGSKSAISVFASNTTDVILDIDGYFASPAPLTLAFYTLTPCRVADTRDPSQPQGLGPPFMPGGQARDFPILKSNCQIPINAQAYSFNMTAVPHGPLGYMTVWPAGQNQPLVSTLNAPTGTVTANAAIVPAGTGGDIEVFPSNDTDLVIDINGYFGVPQGQSALSLYATAPCRALDTRNGNGAFVGKLVVKVVESSCVPPSTAQAYVFNATVVPSGPLGYLTLWPDGTGQPLVATLNAIDGAITSNMAVVPTSNDSIDAYASNLTQLILDISSYFAP